MQNQTYIIFAGNDFSQFSWCCKNSLKSIYPLHCSLKVIFKVGINKYHYCLTSKCSKCKFYITSQLPWTYKFCFIPSSYSIFSLSLVEDCCTSTCNNIWNVLVNFKHCFHFKRVKVWEFTLKNLKSNQHLQAGLPVSV